MVNLLAVPGALLEIAVGVTFLVDPAAVLWIRGFEYYAFGRSGFPCICWGLLTLYKSNDRAVLIFNLLLSTFWAVMLAIALNGTVWGLSLIHI